MRLLEGLIICCKRTILCHYEPACRRNNLLQTNKGRFLSRYRSIEMTKSRFLSRYRSIEMTKGRFLSRYRSIEMTKERFIATDSCGLTDSVELFFFQEPAKHKCQEIRERVEFSIESYILRCQFNPELYIRIP